MIQEELKPARLAAGSSASSDSSVSNPIVNAIVRETLMSACIASRKALTALNARVMSSSGRPNSEVGSFIHAEPQFGHRWGRFVHRILGKLTAVRHSLQRKNTARISSSSKFISPNPFPTSPAVSGQRTSPLWADVIAAVSIWLILSVVDPIATGGRWSFPFERWRRSVFPSTLGQKTDETVGLRASLAIHTPKTSLKLAPPTPLFHSSARD
jgi:hypothetical protein